jgi:hypothetical protein
MYFRTLNLNKFPEFLYHPHLLRYNRLCASLHMWVTGSLIHCNKQRVTCHTHVTVLCRLLVRAQCVIVSEVHSVCSTIDMPRKCVNSSDAFCYVCGLSHPWLIKAMSIISEAKWVIRTRGGLPMFVVWHVLGFSRHRQKVHALCLSPFLWFGKSPRTMIQIATPAWPVLLV